MKKTKRNYSIFLFVIIELLILLLYMFRINEKIGLPSESIFTLSFSIGLPIVILIIYFDAKL